LPLSNHQLPVYCPYQRLNSDPIRLTFPVGYLLNELTESYLFKMLLLVERYRWRWKNYFSSIVNTIFANVGTYSLLCSSNFLSIGYGLFHHLSW